MPIAMHEPARTPSIEWHPGAAQMAPALAVAVLWLLASGLLPMAVAWPWLVLVGSTVAMVLVGHGCRRRSRQLTGVANAIVLDGRAHSMHGAWLAPGWLMIRLGSGRNSRRLWIYHTEVSPCDFARLRRFVRRTLPAVSRRPASTRRVDR